MDDLENAGVVVIDADLFGRELVLDKLVFDPLIGERPGRIEAKRLQVAGKHFHRRDAARLDRFDELCTGREWEIPTNPQAEPLGVGQIVDRGGPRR